MPKNLCVKAEFALALVKDADDGVTKDEGNKRSNALQPVLHANGREVSEDLTHLLA